MPVINLTDLRTSLPKGARLLGLDPGTRTIGVALSDVELRLAGPYASRLRVSGSVLPLSAINSSRCG